MTMTQKFGERITLKTDKSHVVTLTEELPISFCCCRCFNALSLPFMSSSFVIVIVAVGCVRACARVRVCSCLCVYLCVYFGVFVYFVCIVYLHHDHVF